MNPISIWILIFVILNSQRSFASDNDLFCKYPMEKTNSFASLENTLGHDNEGGLFGTNTGVCWWNSWFLFRANYLARFAPHCPGPDIKTKQGRQFYRKLYRKLFLDNQVVIVPGYSNLRELTSSPYQKFVLQQTLQRQMARDTFGKLKFLEGLEGRGHWRDKNISAKKKRKLIESQIEELEQMKSFITQIGPSYAMAQFPGISAHAFIIFKIKKLSDETYSIYVQDSNFQSRLSQFPDAPYRILTYKDGRWYDDRYQQALSFHLYFKREKSLVKTIDTYHKYCQIDRDYSCPVW